MRQNVLKQRHTKLSRQRDVLRLHLNEARWGPPLATIQRIQSAAARANIYPTGDTQRAVEAVAAYFKVAADQVILTTGVDEASDLCMLVLGTPFTIKPGFNGFKDRAAALERTLIEYTLDDYRELPSALIDAARPGRLVMVANPNNPTGMLFDSDQLQVLLRRGCWLLLDETYADFAGGGVGLAWLRYYRRLIVFRSFSKSFGLGGLRIGCLVGRSDVIARLRVRQTYYPLDRLAVEGLLAALESEPDFPYLLAERVLPLRNRLTRELRASGIFQCVLDSCANFVLAICRDATEAYAVQDELATRAQILIASTEPFGIPEGLRITVGNDREIETLISALDALKREKGRVVA